MTHPQDGSAGATNSDAARDTACQANDGCPTELAVLQRFWRNTSSALAEHKAFARARRDSDWWRGYEAALHWIERDAFNADIARKDQP